MKEEARRRALDRDISLNEVVGNSVQIKIKLQVVWVLGSCGLSDSVWVLYSDFGFGRSHGSVGLTWLSIASSTISGLETNGSDFAFPLNTAFILVIFVAPATGW